MAPGRRDQQHARLPVGGERGHGLLQSFEHRVADGVELGGAVERDLHERRRPFDAQVSGHGFFSLGSGPGRLYWGSRRATTGPSRRHAMQPPTKCGIVSAPSIDPVAAARRWSR